MQIDNELKYLKLAVKHLLAENADLRVIAGIYEEKYGSEGLERKQDDIDYEAKEAAGDVVSYMADEGQIPFEDQAEFDQLMADLAKR